MSGNRHRLLGHLRRFGRTAATAALVAVSAACVNEPREDASADGVAEYPLDGPNGRVLLVIPKALPVSVHNTTNPSEQGHKAEVDVSLSEIAKYVSNGTRDAIREVTVLATRLEEREITLKEMKGDTSPTTDCMTELTISPRGKISGVDALMNTVEQAPPFNRSVPFKRHGMLGYVDGSFDRSRIFHAALRPVKGFSVSRYVGTIAADGSPIGFVCGNEFTTRLGSCYVHFNVGDKISVSYRQCLAMLDRWEELHRVAVMIADDFTTFAPATT